MIKRGRSLKRKSIIRRDPPRRGSGLRPILSGDTMRFMNLNKTFAFKGT